MITYSGTIVLFQTSHPARALGVYGKKGTLEFGADADFVLLDPDTLWPQSTYVGGNLVWSVEDGTTDERTSPDS